MCGSTFYHPQRLFMLCHQFWIAEGFATRNVVKQVVALHVDGGLVARVDDALYIFVVVCAFLMSQQTQGINDFLGQPFVQQIIEGPVAILYHIVQEANTFLRIRLAHRTNDKRMEDDGIAITVALAEMGFMRNGDTLLYNALRNGVVVCRPFGNNLNSNKLLLHLFQHYKLA